MKYSHGVKVQLWMVGTCELSQRSGTKFGECPVPAFSKEMITIFVSERNIQSIARGNGENQEFYNLLRKVVRGGPR